MPPRGRALLAIGTGSGRRPGALLSGWRLGSGRPGRPGVGGRRLGTGRRRLVGDRPEDLGPADLDLLERVERPKPLGKGLSEIALQHLADEVGGGSLARLVHQQLAEGVPELAAEPGLQSVLADGDRLEPHLDPVLRRDKQRGIDLGALASGQSTDVVRRQVVAHEAGLGHALAADPLDLKS